MIASTPADVRDAIPHGRATQLKRALVRLLVSDAKVAFPRRGDIPAIKELAQADHRGRRSRRRGGGAPNAFCDAVYTANTIAYI